MITKNKIEVTSDNVILDPVQNVDIKKSENNNKKSRIIGLDLLRIVCCISIIALHNSGFIYNH